MDWCAFTRYVLIGNFVLLAVYDYIIYRTVGNCATITVQTAKMVQGWPLFSLLFGVILGHILWGRYIMPVEAIKNG